jgi:hypothetical protein
MNKFCLLISTILRTATHRHKFHEISLNIFHPLPNQKYSASFEAMHLWDAQCRAVPHSAAQCRAVPLSLHKLEARQKKITKIYLTGIFFKPDVACSPQSPF